MWMADSTSESCSPLSSINNGQILNHREIMEGTALKGITHAEEVFDH